LFTAPRSWRHLSRSARMHERLVLNGEIASPAKAYAAEAVPLRNSRACCH
jgi:hypothetical protein